MTHDSLLDHVEMLSLTSGWIPGWFNVSASLSCVLFMFLKAVSFLSWVSYPPADASRYSHQGTFQGEKVLYGQHKSGSGCTSTFELYDGLSMHKFRGTEQGIEHPKVAGYCCKHAAWCWWSMLQKVWHASCASILRTPQGLYSRTILKLGKSLHTLYNKRQTAGLLHASRLHVCVQEACIVICCSHCSFKFKTSQWRFFNRLEACAVILCFAVFCSNTVFLSRCQHV